MWAVLLGLHLHHDWLIEMLTDHHLKAFVSLLLHKNEYIVAGSAFCIGSVGQFSQNSSKKLIESHNCLKILVHLLEVQWINEAFMGVQYVLTAIGHLMRWISNDTIIVVVESDSSPILREHVDALLKFGCSTQGSFSWQMRESIARVLFHLVNQQQLVTDTTNRFLLCSQLVAGGVFFTLLHIIDEGYSKGEVTSVVFALGAVGKLVDYNFEPSLLAEKEFCRLLFRLINPNVHPNCVQGVNAVGSKRYFFDGSQQKFEQKLTSSRLETTTSFLVLLHKLVPTILKMHKERVKNGIANEEHEEIIMKDDAGNCFNKNQLLEPLLIGNGLVALLEEVFAFRKSLVLFHQCHVGSENNIPDSNTHSRKYFEKNDLISSKLLGCNLSLLCVLLQDHTILNPSFLSRVFEVLKLVMISLPRAVNSSVFSEVAKNGLHLFTLLPFNLTKEERYSLEAVTLFGGNSSYLSHQISCESIHQNSLQNQPQTSEQQQVRQDIEKHLQNLQLQQQDDEQQQQHEDEHKKQIEEEAKISERRQELLRQLEEEEIDKRLLQRQKILKRLQQQQSLEESQRKLSALDVPLIVNEMQPLSETLEDATNFDARPQNPERSVGNGSSILSTHSSSSAKLKFTPVVAPNGWEYLDGSDKLSLFRRKRLPHSLLNLEQCNGLVPIVSSGKIGQEKENQLSVIPKVGFVEIANEQSSHQESTPPKLTLTTSSVSVEKFLNEDDDSDRSIHSIDEENDEQEVNDANELLTGTDVLPFRKKSIGILFRRISNSRSPSSQKLVDFSEQTIGNPTTLHRKAGTLYAGSESGYNWGMSLNSQLVDGLLTEFTKARDSTSLSENWKRKQLTRKLAKTLQCLF